MQLVFIGADGTVRQRKDVNDDIEPCQLVKDLMANEDPLYIKTCHGVLYPNELLKAAKSAWEVEVTGVHQQTGETFFSRFVRTVKVS
jgi:hypothetical protein